MKISRFQQKSQKFHLSISQRWISTAKKVINEAIKYQVSKGEQLNTHLPSVSTKAEQDFS